MGREDKSEEMTMRARIEQSLKQEEQQGGNEVRLHTLRLIKCALEDRDVCARERGVGSGCPEEELLDTLTTMVAQREVSAREYDEAGRIEDAIREREEIEILKDFLPQTLQGEALKSAVQEIIDDLGASRLKDLGRCMSALKERYPGKIDKSVAGKVVREALS